MEIVKDYSISWFWSTEKGDHFIFCDQHNIFSHENYIFEYTLYYVKSIDQTHPSLQGSEINLVLLFLTEMAWENIWCVDELLSYLILKLMLIKASWHRKNCR